MPILERCLAVIPLFFSIPVQSVLTRSSKRAIKRIGIDPKDLPPITGNIKQGPGVEFSWGCQTPALNIGRAALSFGVKGDVNYRFGSEAGANAEKGKNHSMERYIRICERESIFPHAPGIRQGKQHCIQQ